MTAQAIVPSSFPWLDTSKYSFSLGIEAAGASWLAGQTASAFDPESGRVEIKGDGGDQAALSWAKLGRVLDAADRTADDCSEIVEYVTAEGLSGREAIASARPTTNPVSTMVVESLVRPTAQVEIELVAGHSPGLVRIPQVLPIDENGDVVAAGDFIRQCEWALEEAERRLGEHGLDLSHVVKVVQQTTPDTRSSYRRTADARRRLLGPVFPSSTGVLTSALPHPDALVALDVWASSEPKSVVPYAEEAYSSLTFAPAVAAGDLLFISGTTAWDPNSGETVAPGDLAGQAEFIYDQIAQVCALAGTGIDRLIKTIEYVSPDGLDRYRDVAAVRERVLTDPYPASTGVVVAGLLSRAWLLEVEAVAVLR